MLPVLRQIRRVDYDANQSPRLNLRRCIRLVNAYGSDQYVVR